MNSAKEVSNAFIEAFGKKEFDRAGEFLSKEEFSFVGPLEQHNRAEGLVAALKMLGPIMEGIKVRQVFEQGENVCQIYDFISSQEAIGTTRIVEWHTVRNGKIVRVEIFFDPRPYAAMFAKQA